MNAINSERIRYLLIGMVLGALLLLAKIELEDAWRADCCPCVTTTQTGK